MCECIKTPGIIAGWKCCHCITPDDCHIYNGLQRETCRGCNQPRCKPLLPDSDTGEKFETYEEAYVNDPELLATIHEQLRRAAGTRK